LPNPALFEIKASLRSGGRRVSSLRCGPRRQCPSQLVRHPT